METFAKIELVTVRSDEPFVLAFADEVLEVSEAEIVDEKSDGSFAMEFTLAVLRRAV